MTGARVAVMGIGAAGEVTARLLSGAEGVAMVRVSDVRAQRLREVSGKLDGAVEAVRADLRIARDVRRACRGVDVVVNASLPDFNLALMRGALRQRAHYVDLASQGSPDSGAPSKVHEQLSLDGPFREAGRTALLGLGVAPGLTNLFARRAASRFDSISAIRIRVFGSGYANVDGHPLAPLFSPATFLEEVLWPAPVWKGDRIVKLPPFSGEEEFRFPDPIGTAYCYNVNNEETETMPRFLGKAVGSIDFKYAIAPSRRVLLENLLRLGLTSRTPVRAGGKRIAPLDVLLAVLPDPASLSGRVSGHTCVVVELDGRTARRRASVRMWTAMAHEEAQRRMGVHATAFLTGAPPAAAVLSLIHGEVQRSGVTTGGGVDPVPILRRAVSMGVPLFEGPAGAVRGRPLDLDT